MPLVSTMVEQVRADGLIAPRRPLVVLFSGGRDSTCLLDLSVTLAGAQSVHALHLNYGLRAAAERDEHHCRVLCERLGVGLTVRHPASATVGNLQAWAREERFAAARAVCETLDAAVIATGFTATDQVETILYRLISSPSRRALLGVDQRRGTVIRPLLGFTRAQTGAYCIERGLEWVDDETNASGKYVRNRIRNELVPLLGELHPGAERNILTLAATLRQEQRVLEELVDREIAADDTTVTIPLQRLRALPPGLARLVVQRMADAVRGQPTPGAGGRLDEILALPERGTAHLDLPHRIRATVTSGRLRFTETDAKPRDRASAPGK